MLAEDPLPLAPGMAALWEGDGALALDDACSPCACRACTSTSCPVVSPRALHTGRSECDLIELKHCIYKASATAPHIPPHFLGSAHTCPLLAVGPDVGAVAPPAVPPTPAELVGLAVADDATGGLA